MKRTPKMILWLLLPLAACSKSDDKTSPSGGCSEGKVRVTNNSKNPYSVDLDNKYYGTLQGGTYYDLNLSKGTHFLHSKQVSGYILYPTEANRSVNVQGCDNQEWIFP